MSDPDVRTVHHRLRQTIRWCAHQGPPAGALRVLTDWHAHWMQTPEEHSHVVTVQPAAIFRTPTFLPTSLIQALGYEERQAIVDEVAEKRALLLGQMELRHAFTSIPMDGRLLVYEPDLTDESGGPTVYSDGYFDWDDAPPWETWLTYIHEGATWDARGREWQAYLVSWVPSWLVDVVSAGIDAAPMGCLKWASDLIVCPETGSAMADVLASV